MNKALQKLRKKSKKDVSVGGVTLYIDQSTPLSYPFKAEMTVKKSAKTGKNFNTFQRGGEGGNFAGCPLYILVPLPKCVLTYKKKVKLRGL